MNQYNESTNKNESVEFESLPEAVPHAGIAIRVGSTLLAFIVLASFIATVYQAETSGKPLNGLLLAAMFFPFYGLVQLVTLVLTVCFKRASSQAFLIAASIVYAAMFYHAYVTSFHSSNPQAEVYFLVVVGLESWIFMPVFWTGAILTTCLAKTGKRTQ